MTQGSRVVSNSAEGSAKPGFFSGVLGELSRGVRGFIDIELAERAGSVPDQADVRQAAPAADPSNPQRSGFADIITTLSPVQIGGLILAAGLAFGLATGKFR